MARQLLPILALLTSTAFLLTANGLHALLLPLRGTAEHFSTTEIGLVGTGWAAGFVLGCLLAPAIVQRVGHIRAFSAAAASAAIIILLNGLLVLPASWILLRVCSGFALAGAFMIIESWLNERATNENRGTIFSLYLTVTYVAITAGQFLVAAADPRRPASFMLGAIFFCLAVLPTALSTAQSPRPLTRARLDLRKLFGNSPVAFVTVTMIGVVNGAFGTLAAVFGVETGLSTGLIALMMGITIIAGAITQLPAGRLSDRTDRRYVIAGAALSSAATGLAIYLLEPVDATALLVLTGIYGALTYPLYGLAVAHANDFAEPDDFVAVSGGLLLLYGLGTMVGPLAAGFVMAHLGPAALFLVTATGHTLIAIYAILRTFKRAPVPEEVRGPFQTVPISRALTTGTALLDPRAEEPAAGGDELENTAERDPELAEAE
ncbi:MFS transporter [Propylenella binzhouense]|uniref:MFS transporter n=1 Tax=Propylenella binzhouense TaxID=2555902 RepID=UPI001FEB4CA2|nr:MFS transporter [Propylenella binzhouense]